MRVLSVGHDGPRVALDEGDEAFHLATDVQGAWAPGLRNLEAYTVPEGRAYVVLSVTAAIQISDVSNPGGQSVDLGVGPPGAAPPDRRDRVVLNARAASMAALSGDNHWQGFGAIDAPMLLQVAAGQQLYFSLTGSGGADVTTGASCWGIEYAVAE